MMSGFVEYIFLSYRLGATMDPIFANALVGTAIGIVSSFIVICFSHAVLAPKLRFSTDVRSYFDEAENLYRYSVRIKKNGYIDLIDTRIQCRLVIEDVRKSGGNMINSYRLPTDWHDALFIKSASRFVRIKIKESDLLDRERNPLFNKHIKLLFPDIGLRLEDIYLSYEKAYVQVFVLGHDRFTGIKKLFESPRYYLHNLRDGKWNNFDIVDL